MTQGDTPMQGDTGVQGDTPPTVRQLVHSAYAWGNGDMQYGEIVAIEDLDVDDTSLGDSLLEFLCRETSPDRSWLGDEAPEEDSLAHWEQARHRMALVLAEVQEVFNALHRYGPGPES